MGNQIKHPCFHGACNLVGTEVWERLTSYRQLQPHWVNDVGIDKTDPHVDLQVKVSFLVEVAVELSLGGQQSHQLGCQPYSRWSWTR